jgi:hypothetical protein
MINTPQPIYGSQDLLYAVSGMFFTDLYYGTEPEFVTYSALSGGTNSFSSLELQPGTTYSSGSLVVGGIGPSGTLQTFDLENRVLLSDYQYPTDLYTDHIEDFS